MPRSFLLSYGPPPSLSLSRLLLIPLTRFPILDQGIEGALGVREELLRGVVLDDLALVHHHHLVRVQDRVQAMCHRQTSRIGELLSNGFLNGSIGFNIHRSCGLVHDDDARLGEKGARNAEELSLPNAKVASVVLYSILKTADGTLELSSPNALKRKGDEGQKSRGEGGEEDTRPPSTVRQCTS
jgi:hypothetical protein